MSVIGPVQSHYHEGSPIAVPKNRAFGCGLMMLCCKVVGFVFFFCGHTVVSICLIIQPYSNKILLTYK